ncbi:MAG: DEAD/DEAH box helicase [Muribaculaceae bacterium]|nr:DEAD/DEAH box helicase [Muribaculaceae bacterium]
MDNKDFSRFELSEAILQGINEMNITTPTKIQEASLLDIIHGEDVIGKAQTGTGKTLAFVAGLATRYPNSMGYLRGLILAPTRELAIQIQEEFMRICKYTHLSCLAVYGGSDIVKQIRQIKRGVDVIVGTPGRVMDLMDKRVIRLKDVDFVVIDEADEMLNMGFVEDIEYILKDASQDRQTLLFSATMPKSILKITETYLKKDAKKIFIEEKSSTSINVRQFYYEIRESERYEALCRLLDGYQIESAMIFCKTKKEVDELASWMVKSNYHVGFMHVDLSQESRLETLNRFKRGQLKYLVATDVASRGIDVKNVSHVINYTLPQDSESYVHRIGRCGRASQKGVAFNLVTTRELGMIHLIKKEQKASIAVTFNQLQKKL